MFAPVGWDALPGWQDDAVQDAWPAFVAGCRAPAGPARARAALEDACAGSNRVDGRDPQAVKAFFEAHFSPYRVTFPDGRDAGLFTGYYEPLLIGSRTRSARNAVPLFGVPDDLLAVDLAPLHPELKDKRVRGRLDGRRVVPYWTRAEIDAGKGPPDEKALAWTADPLDAFFLQVQGSGRVELDDGRVIRLGYADQNGHPYTSIGRVLVERGTLTPEGATLPGIRAWAAANRDDVPALLARNASYVFFREVPAPAPAPGGPAIDGPLGSLGVPLLAQRTVAVDPRAIPLGAPVFIDTRVPGSGEPMRRLVMAQDTGGAIRGAVRVDVFWGFGADAADAAGRMREQGRLFLLWPRGVPLPAPAAAPGAAR